MKRCIVLTKLKKQLKQQGYAVKPFWAGLGFVPFELIKILVKTKKTRVSTQHIIMEDIKESSRSNFPPRISMFGRIEAPTTQASMFTNMDSFNQVERNLTHILHIPHIPQRSTQQRIEAVSRKSWQ